MSIGSKIKAIRKERGLTQKELGELCDMADSAIRRLENGRTNPTHKTLARIANKLEVSIGDLWEGENGDYIFNKRIQNELVSFKTAIVVIKKGEIEFVMGSNNDDNGTTDIAQLIIQLLYELNARGQDKVIDYARKLTKDPKYQRRSPLKQLPDENLTKDAPEQEKPPKGP